METEASEVGTEVLTRLHGKFVKVRAHYHCYIFTLSVRPSVRPFDGPL